MNLNEWEIAKQINEKKNKENIVLSVMKQIK